MLGFCIGAFYNGLALHITDKLTNTNLPKIILVTAAGALVTWLITFIWPNIFTAALLCGAGIVFIGFIGLCAYFTLCPNDSE